MTYRKMGRETDSLLYGVQHVDEDIETLKMSFGIQCTGQASDLHHGLDMNGHRQCNCEIYVSLSYHPICHSSSYVVYLL